MTDRYRDELIKLFLAILIPGGMIYIVYRGLRFYTEKTSRVEPFKKSVR